MTNLLKHNTGIKLIPTLQILLVCLFFWIQDVPQGLTLSAYHLLIIFIATIIAIIVKVLPMGAVTFVALTTCVLTKTLSLDNVLETFSSSIVWLVVISFFLAKGFIKTGLGNRIAYFFVKHLGQSPVGLAYGFTLTELILAPLIPSNTARGAGIIFPIVKSLAHEEKSFPNHPSSKKIGAYLISICFHANTITSAMFLTALVGNPLMASFARSMDIYLNWGTWFIAASVPGLISLAVLPWILVKFLKPNQNRGNEASEMAARKLIEMGRLSGAEYIMLVNFFIILVLWIFGRHFGVEPTLAALIGFSVLVITGVLSWDDVIQDKGAWETLMWFAPLLMLATQLSKLGFIAWFSKHMTHSISGLDWPVAFVILGFIYFYSHYLFASITAHITALYSTFLVILVSIGAPPVISALVLAYFSALSGTLTHYGSGTAPVFYGAGYMSIAEWWKIGFIVSVMNLIIWGGLGTLWWRFLGYL